MNYGERLQEVAMRKARLVAQCARQREAIAIDLRACRGPLALVDGGMAAVQFLKKHPVTVGAVLAGAALFGRRPLLRWAGRGLVVWRGLRTVRTLLGMLSA